MKTIRAFRILGLSILLLSGVAVSSTTKAQPGINISFQTFYNDLSPYGRWVRNPQYGSVWIPDVARDFQPYSTNGYWEVTEYGNTWVSDYEWGWAPFHYGRWSYDDYTGWFWVPDYEWGPAWVNWRTGGGYYGWAPLGPGISINVSFNAPSFWWNFVLQRYITYRDWRGYCAPQRRFTQVYNQTVIINNYYRSNNRTYVYGPRRDEIERVTRRSVPVRTIDASERGRGRVIVAESGRGNDRYNSRERDEPTRRGATIDAGRGRDNSDYNARERSGNGRSGANDDNGRDDRIGRSPSIPADRGNSRNERNGSPEASPSYDAGRNNRYETPRQPERSREQNVPNYGNERGSREQNVPNYGNERGSRERSMPNNSSERSSRSNRSAESPSQGSGRGSYEAPQRSSRQERSAEPRGNERSERSSQPSQERGTSGRSSRSPR